MSGSHTGWLLSGWLTSQLNYNTTVLYVTIHKFEVQIIYIRGNGVYTLSKLGGCWRDVNFENNLTPSRHRVSDFAISASHSSSLNDAQKALVHCMP